MGRTPDWNARDRPRSDRSRSLAPIVDAVVAEVYSASESSGKPMTFGFASIPTQLSLKSINGYGPLAG